MPPSLAELRARIAALEGVGREKGAGVMPLGVAEIDGALPWGGLPLGCLHEIEGGGDGAPLGFAALWLARLAAGLDKPVLWVAAGDPPYAPGLAGFGLGPARLVVVRAAKPAQALWAMEEGLRCPALAGVLGEVGGLDVTAARRLQLAAQGSGVSALLINRGALAGSAVTRWRVVSAASIGPPGEGVGPWRWWVELTRCRGRGLKEDGGVAAWLVEWADETGCLGVVAASGDRPAMPRGRRRAG